MTTMQVEPINYWDDEDAEQECRALTKSIGRDEAIRAAGLREALFEDRGDRYTAGFWARVALFLGIDQMYEETYA